MKNKAIQQQTNQLTDFKNYKNINKNNKYSNKWTTKRNINK